MLVATLPTGICLELGVCTWPCPYFGSQACFAPADAHVEDHLGDLFMGAGFWGGEAAFLIQGIGPLVHSGQARQWHWPQSGEGRSMAPGALPS